MSRNPRNFLSNAGGSAGNPQSLFVGHRYPLVAFDAYRNKPFNQEQTVLTYDGTSVNKGNALDPATGEFRAPYPGMYAFNFHSLTRDGTATYVKIMMNGRNVGGAYRRHEGEGDEAHDSVVRFSVQYCPTEHVRECDTLRHDDLACKNVL